MLVLSRREGESVMIGDDFMVTVSKIAADRAQIQLSQRTVVHRLTFFDPIREGWLVPGQSVAIADDITCKLVLITGDKIRLGFSMPKGIPLHRKEVYDAIRHPRGHR